jgi:Ca2+-dependent lipid-binding protein
MDDMLYPAYSSSKIKQASYTFNETGDAMVRELDLSRITLRLVSEVDQKGEDDEDDIKAKITGSTLDTLKRCLYTPVQISLKGKDGRESKVTVSMRYLPVKMQLDPSESFNNAGNLRVEVLDAADLPAADRNGYSDPYCKFMLDGKEIYKTKTQKKTLTPSWNEYFETPIRSRTAADFKVDVYDWDFADKADHLGAAVIDLNNLEPFQAKEVRLNLDGKSGALRLKMLFKPDYVTRSRQGSSTFSGTFAAPGKIIGAPVKGASFVGGGVAKGASFLGKSFKRSSSNQHTPQASQEVSGGVADMRDTSMDVGEANGTSGKPLPQTPHKRERSFGQYSQSPAVEQGTATVSVLSASGFQADTKLEIRILHDSAKGLKEILKTKATKTKTGEMTYDDETKKVPCNADQQFRVMAFDSHTFGSDDQLGEQSFFINDQSAGGTQEVKVGSGVVVIRSSFVPNDASSLRPDSAAPDSPASKHKGMGRLMSRKERSVTPSG